ncbi:MAG: cytochrome c3 family protein [Lentimicrobiaceae bacterium]|jgi:predicted CXXCH cytochrome family protein
MDKSLLFFVLLPFIIIQGYFSSGIPDNNSTTDGKQGYTQALSEEPRCADCHSDLLESEIVHGPALGSCENCHQVNMKEHTENGARGLNLTKSVPELCYSCHVDEKKDFAAMPDIHQAIEGENSCTACHSPHSSDVKKLLLTQPKKLCLSCHNKDFKANGEKTVNIKMLLANSKVIHPPAEKGCLACHQPHGSTNNYLLISAFPKGNYAPAARDTFALCWECHDSDLLELANTDASTNFREGDKNLHYIHMTGKKSRSCIMCHNMHASANMYLIEDKVQFGEWGLPINFFPNENGGSCFPGCHNEKAYTR